MTPKKQKPRTVATGRGSKSAHSRHRKAAKKKPTRKPTLRQLANSAGTKHLRDEGISAALQNKAKIGVVLGAFGIEHIAFSFFDKNKREITTDTGTPFKRWRHIGETTDGRKYSQQYGAGNHAYLPLITDWTENAGFDIAEGEKDSLICCANKIRTVGISGHSSWKNRDGKLVAEIRSLKPKGKRITLVPDNNYNTNHQVENGWNRLAVILINLGADVWFRWLPPGEANGPGDYIRIHGRASYKKLPTERADKDKLAVDNHRHLTDVGNANRLVDQIKDQWIYVPELGRWLRYDGTCYHTDTTGQITQEAKATTIMIYREAADGKDENWRIKLAAWAAKSESEPRLKAMISLARPDPSITVSQDRLDCDPFLLSVRNGVVDLRTGKLIPASPDQLITQQAPLEFDRSARAPHWVEFLNKICSGDRALIAYLQRAIGYTLTGCTGEQVLFFLHGNGQNGKSVLIETLSYILGDYSASAPSSMLMKTHNEAIPNDVARLRGRRMASLSELDVGDRFNESKIKQYSGGDEVPARFLHQEWFDFIPTFKMWIHGNHKPLIRGQDKGIWRRIVLILFEHEIPDTERVLDYAKNYLYPEASGILNWAIKGCLEWQSKGLAPTPKIKAQTELYRDESDILGDFIADRCDEDPEYKATTTELYRAYSKFCDNRNEKPMTSTMFGRLMGERFQRLGKKRPPLYVGLRVADARRRRVRK